MYFSGNSEFGEIIMMFIYGGLTLFWLFVLTYILVTIQVASTVLRYSGFRTIAYSFIILSFLLFFDSLYWTLGTASRIELLPPNVNDFFYFSWHIVVVKSMLLIAGIVFFTLFRRTADSLEKRFSTLYFTQFLDSDINAVGVLDVDGKVLFWNKGAERLYGFSKSEVTGRNIRDFLVPKRFYGHLSSEMKKLAEEQEPTRFCVYRNTKNNGEIAVDVTMTPFEDNGNFAGYFGVMRPAEEKEVINFEDFPPFPDNELPLTSQHYDQDWLNRTINQTLTNRSIYVFFSVSIALVLLIFIFLVNPEYIKYVLTSLAICLVLIFILALRFLSLGINPTGSRTKLMEKRSTKDNKKFDYSSANEDRD